MLIDKYNLQDREQFGYKMAFKLGSSLGKPYYYFWFFLSNFNIVQNTRYKYYFHNIHHFLHRAITSIPEHCKTRTVVWWPTHTPSLLPIYHVTLISDIINTKMYYIYLYIGNDFLLIKIIEVS